MEFIPPNDQTKLDDVVDVGDTSPAFQEPGVDAVALLKSESASRGWIAFKARAKANPGASQSVQFDEQCTL
jgi:hypothetical protein